MRPRKNAVPLTFSLSKVESFLEKIRTMATALEPAAKNSEFAAGQVAMARLIEKEMIQLFGLQPDQKRETA